jgi:hypothetical protein
VSRTTLLTVLSPRFFFALPDQLVYDADARRPVGSEGFLNGPDRLREGWQVNAVFVLAQDQVHGSGGGDKRTDIDMKGVGRSRANPVAAGGTQWLPEPRQQSVPDREETI